MEKTVVEPETWLHIDGFIETDLDKLLSMAIMMQRDKRINNTKIGKELFAFYSKVQDFAKAEFEKLIIE